ncbi:class I SAM-dependent methyltransferase [Anaerosporobacter faecicola]|uniref:class I SAM-dependent methyltransferase n=1 Tax=Anaerosporobacter faecicola TaxID=2718714 RepID=UPI00143BA59A|nr:class I SAM-dependent methyltransferase [Anaerosporobacter faecicola]
MKEIDCNKEAWGLLSQDHYATFLNRYQKGAYQLNSIIQKELGNVTGKRIIHLQCNTGADTIQLAKMGASEVVGVDLVPDNVVYAKKLAKELGVNQAQFIESDIMKLSELHMGQYDIVFTSEGVLGWLPDLDVWANTISHLLSEDGFFYIFDSHPFFLSFDESKLGKNVTEIKYPYFGKEPDESEEIGGYASEVKEGAKNYFWMHTVSDIINALTRAGLHVEFFNEYPENYYNIGDMDEIKGTGLYEYVQNKDKYPISFSLKASIYHNRK